MQTTDQSRAKQELQARLIEMTAVDEHEVSCLYRDHEILVSRDFEGDDWYIQVFAPCGRMAYDGWWHCSTDKSAEEAVLEALTGALLREKGGE
ncbi:hypothetical protein HA052_15920 [Chromobacterium haemolyticum]|uniref:Uncharacterized protein n=1 Tax=Chromobacterium fluminis TaxID=3044269 RepID=A0ABX0L6R0_9NEIS|nr:hypothetical protein [Chromobacterium haemolyticum]NHR06676.1 hypothetical protein [Chromobacterium haemolyticum]